MNAGVQEDIIHSEANARIPVITQGVSRWKVCEDWLRGKFLLGALACFLLGGVIFLQHELDRRSNHTAEKVSQLRFLVPGEALKPALLGFHHVGADVLWLQIIQVLGDTAVRQEDYEWLHHALNVLTTLDPQYVSAYDLGALAMTELAGRVDWGNELLQKGITANPTAWRLPFQLGFNQFFYQQDFVRAAESMAMAARLPGRPPYVPELAARLYVQGRSPDLALKFLQAMLDHTQDEQARFVLETRAKEVLIERDIDNIEKALTTFLNQFGHAPRSLSELVQAQLLTTIPTEPFGGDYRLDPITGAVTSSTHPTRLRIHSPSNSVAMASSER